MTTHESPLPVMDAAETLKGPPAEAREDPPAEAREDPPAEDAESPIVRLLASDLKWGILRYFRLEELPALIFAFRVLSRPFTEEEGTGKRLDLVKALAHYSRTCQVRLKQIVHRNVPAGDLRCVLLQRLALRDLSNVGRALLLAAENDRGDVIRHVVDSPWGRVAWSGVVRAAIDDKIAVDVDGDDVVLGDSVDEDGKVVLDAAEWESYGYELLFMAAAIGWNVRALAALRDTGVATDMDRTFAVRYSEDLIELFMKGKWKDLPGLLPLLESDWGVPRGTMWEYLLSQALDVEDRAFVEFLRQKWGVTDEALCGMLCEAISDPTFDAGWMEGDLWGYLCETLAPELIERLKAVKTFPDYGWLGNPEPEW